VSTVQDTLRGAGTLARERLGSALDNATRGQQPSGWRHTGPRTLRGAFAGTARTYTLSCTAYISVFLLVAGAPGTREPLPTWFLGQATGVGLTAHAVLTLCVAVAGSLLAHLLRATPYRGGRWFEEAPWAFAAGMAFTCGTAVQMRLSNSPVDALIPSLALLLGMLVAAPWVLLGVERLGPSDRTALALSWTTSSAAFVIRFVLPALTGGSIARGEVLGVNVGEITRAMVIVATAMALAGFERQSLEHTLGRTNVPQLLGVLARRLTPALLYMCGLFAVRDRGPALVLAAVVLALILASAPTRSVRQLVPVALGLVSAVAAAGLLLPLAGVPALSDAQQTLRTRVLDAGCTGGELTQACKSQRILHLTGLAPDVDPFGSPLTRTLEAANSDYAPALVGGALGMAALLLLLAGVVATAARVVSAATLSPLPRTEQRDMYARFALGSGMAVLVTACWLGIALLLPRIPFTDATVPLTGLDVPFLSANGGSALAYGFLTGLAVMALRANARTRSRHGGDRPGGTVGRVAGVCLLIMAVGVAWIAFGRGPVSAGSTRLASESLLRDTQGLILTRDGQVFSRPADDSGERVYPRPAWGVDLGFFRSGPSINQAAGVEYLAAPLLTCGRHRGGPAAGLLAKCRSADVVSTVDGRLQTLAGQSAASASAAAAGHSPDTTAAVVVVERGSGAVRAVATSASEDPVMQSIVAGESPQWLPAALASPDDEPTARSIRSYALQMLSPLAANCVTPDPERGLSNPFDATREECEADRGTLRMMQAFRQAAPPGSTFKVVTALAAETSDTGLPGTSLGDRLTAVGETDVEPPLNNRSGFGACPQETITAMLQHSCNTTAGWFGVTAGADAMNGAAAALGFDPTDVPDTVRDEAGTVYGPADPSAADQAPGALYFNTSRTGLTSGEQDASSLARAAIGQQGARSSLMDLVGVAATVADARIPRLTLIDGICRQHSFESVPAPRDSVPSVALDPTALSAIREGLTLAVTDAAGTARGMDRYAVRMAKTGTAEEGDGYHRWVMGATDSHVFAARVGPVSDPTGHSPAVGLAESVLGGLIGLQESARWDTDSPCAVGGGH
jgi:cell division protein FtsW (lipid II flippase)